METLATGSIKEFASGAGNVARLTYIQLTSISVDLALINNGTIRKQEWNGRFVLLDCVQDGARTEVEDPFGHGPDC
jgi:hypothetical protein